MLEPTLIPTKIQDLVRQLGNINYFQLKNKLLEFCEVKLNVNIPNQERAFFLAAQAQLNLLSMIKESVADDDNARFDITRLLFLLVLIKDRNLDYSRTLTQKTAALIPAEKEKLVRDYKPNDKFIYNDLNTALSNASYVSSYEQGAALVKQVASTASQVASSVLEIVYYTAGALSSTIWGAPREQTGAPREETPTTNNDSGPLQMTDEINTPPHRR